MLNGRVTRMGIAAVYAPQSKHKVFWALILAGDEGRKGNFRVRIQQSNIRDRPTVACKNLRRS